MHIKEETRKLVLEAISELDFHPSAAARSLVLRKSRSIGLVIADIANPFFPEIVRGAEDVANSHNYNVILCNTDEKPEKERAYFDLLREKQVDGIILSGSRVGADEIIALARSGISVVVINRDIGIPFDDALVAQSDPTREGGYKAMASLLGRFSRLTAVFASNDLQAIGAIDAIRERGLGVPLDIAVIGFDDIQLAAFATPPLTTFRQPKYQMGQKAMEMLIRMISHEAIRENRIVVEPQMVIRESCGYGQFSASRGAKAAVHER